MSGIASPSLIPDILNEVSSWEIRSSGGSSPRQENPCCSISAAAEKGVLLKKSTPPHSIQVWGSSPKSSCAR